MAAYVLHVVNRQEGTLVTKPSTDPYNVDFLFEVLTGPFAARRGTHRELSELIGETIIVMSGTVGICHESGAILDWKGTVDAGQWIQRHVPLIEREVGSAMSV